MVALFLKFRGKQGAAPPTPEPTVTITTGTTLQAAGTGRQPVADGVTIVGGNSLGHWQISGGFLSPTSAAVSASYSGAPYFISLSDGNVVRIDADPNVVAVYADGVDTSEWTGVWSRTSAELAGKTILLRAGTSFDPGITGGAGTLRDRAFGFESSAWAGLTITSEDVANPVVWPGIVLRGTQYVTFRGIKWEAGTGNAVQFIASAAYPVTDVTWDQCVFQATPRDASEGTDWTGNITDVQIGTGDGSTTTFGYTTPQGKVWSEVGWPGSANAAVVTAGAVTGTTGAAGNTVITGTGIASGSIVTTTGAITVTFSTPPANGVPVMLNYKVTALQLWANTYAFAVSSGDAYVANIAITNSTFDSHQRTLVLAPRGGLAAGTNGQASGNLVTRDLDFSGNLIDNYFDVGTQIAGTTSGTAWVEFNRYRRCAGMSSDNRNPHSDAILGSGNSATAAKCTAHINGNIIDSRGSRSQPAPIALRDYSQGGSWAGGMWLGEINGNLVRANSTEGILVEQAESFTSMNNTVVKLDASSPSAAVEIGSGVGGDWKTSGTHTVSNNITETGAYAGGSAIMADNVQTTGASGGTPYTSVFVGPTFDTSDYPDVLDRFAMKPGGPADLGEAINVGAVGSGAVDWPTTSPGTGQINV